MPEIQRIKVTHTLVRSLNFNYIFFPGVVFHELAHALMSTLLGARVVGGRYWGKQNAAIVHEEVPGLRGFLISMAPFYVGSIVALAFVYLAQRNVVYLGNPVAIFQSLFLYWLGMSAAYHCFPSLKDVNNARYELSSWYSKALSFALGPLSGVFAWVTVPLYIILYVFTIPMAFFSQIASLGLVWFVVLFFASAVYFV
jgi:hypothetical protein